SGRSSSCESLSSARRAPSRASRPSWTHCSTVARTSSPDTRSAQPKPSCASVSAAARGSTAGRKTMRDRIITAKEMKAFLGFISALFWALVATAAVTGYQFGIDYAVLNLLLAVIVRQLLLETALFGLVKMLVGAV